MSEKSSTRKKSAPADETSEPQSQTVSLVAVGVAIAGLAGLALAFLLTDDPAEHVSPVPTRGIGDTWELTPEADLSYTAGRDQVRGPEDAAVSIVVFSDFECPYCQEASGELEALAAAYPDDVRIVFRNYPLDTACNENMKQPGHLHACKAAIMGRCAAEQDRFWEMHDAIYGLTGLSADALDALPNELGLEMDAFNACTASDPPLEDVKADIAEGHALGVTGTPAIFVNRRRMESFRAAPLGVLVEHIAAQAGDR